MSMCVCFVDTLYSLNGLSYFYLSGVNRFVVVVKLTLGTSNLKKTKCNFFSGVGFFFNNSLLILASVIDVKSNASSLKCRLADYTSVKPTTSQKIV